MITATSFISPPQLPQSSGPLRAGESDAELAERMRRAVARKAAGHMISLPGFRRPDRPMHAIGG